MTHEEKITFLMFYLHFSEDSTIVYTMVELVT